MDLVSKGSVSRDGLYDGDIEMSTASWTQVLHSMHDAHSSFSLPEATYLPFSHSSLGSGKIMKNEPFVCSPVFAMERFWAMMLQSKVLPLGSLAIGTIMHIN